MNQAIASKNEAFVLEDENLGGRVTESSPEAIEYILDEFGKHAKSRNC
jgi:hypothetical protein